MPGGRQPGTSITKQPQEGMMQINLDHVVQILRENHGLQDAAVHVTSGGCATVYVGPPVQVDPAYDPAWTVPLVFAGPGTYGTPSTADLRDLYVGRSDDELNAVDASVVGATDEASVARIIARCLVTQPEYSSGEDERPQCEECDQTREVGAPHGLCDSCYHDARRSGAFD